MSIETKTITTQANLQIGLSDFLNNLFTNGDLTADELAKYSWCASKNPMWGAVGKTDLDLSVQQGAAATQQISYFVAPMGGTAYKTIYNDNRLTSKQLYSFNILLYINNRNINMSNITVDNANNARLVTAIDMAKIAMTLRTEPKSLGKQNYIYPESGNFDIWNGGVDDYNHDDLSIKVWNSSGKYWDIIRNIIPFQVIADDEGVLFISYPDYLYDNRFTSPDYSITIPKGDYITDMKIACYKGLIKDYTKTVNLLRYVGNGAEISDQVWKNENDIYGCWKYNDDFSVIVNQTNQVYGNMNMDYYVNPNSLETVKKLTALVGLRVYIGDDKTKVIKPIIKDGLVVGYSEDVDAESEIDNIVDLTGNNVSPYAPSGESTSDVDQYDKIGLTLNANGQSFVKWFAVDAENLSKLLIVS